MRKNIAAILMESLEDRVCLSAAPVGAAPAAPPAPALPPVTITTRKLGTMNQLDIVGTSSNDSILVTQSGTTLTIVANGRTIKFTGAIDEIMIDGVTGGDTITVDSSVIINTLVYSGKGGSNTITDLGRGWNVIVTVGNSAADKVRGNGVNTSYWADGNDALTYTTAEYAAGGVHRITDYYQPFSTSPTNAKYIPLTRNGQALPDPTDTGTTIRLTNRALWGTAPTMADVNQGGLGDCYFLADLAALANQSPNRLRNMAVDLGDGTYAVQFVRSGVTSYVRVDGDLSAGYFNGLAYAHPGASGDIWAPIMEKAYAFFRTGANTYNSLNAGWMGSVFSDLGLANTTLYLKSSVSSLVSLFQTALNAGKTVTVATNSAIIGGSSLIGNHAYSLIGASITQGVATFLIRNPWGVDGIGHDANPNDGLVTLTATDMLNNIVWGSMVT